MTGLQWDRVQDTKGLGTLIKHTEDGRGNEKEGLGLVSNELLNEKLKRELMTRGTSGKVEFTEEEWESFEIKELKKDHFVEAGSGVYFKPHVEERYVDVKELEENELEELCKLRETPSGLKWRNVGNQRPSEGDELRNALLVAELRKKTEFTDAEWENFGVTTCGLKWRNVGRQKPTEGLQLTNQSLAAELQKNHLEFKQAEWTRFGIKHICPNHFVMAGDACFEPDESALRSSNFIKVGRAYFQPAEEPKLEVKSLTSSHYIKAGDKYYQPFVDGEKYRQVKSYHFSEEQEIAQAKTVVAKEKASGLVWYNIGGQKPNEGK